MTVGKVKPSVPTGASRARFPWRLLLWALLATALAGAGGYFTWQFRDRAKESGAALAVCAEDLELARSSGKLAAANSATCTSERDAAVTERDEIRAKLSELEKNLDVKSEELTALRAQRAETEKRIKAIVDIQQQFAEMIDTGQLAVTSRRGSLVVELPAEVLFPSGSAELSKKGELAVLEVGIILKKFPDRRFLVVGHTDNLALKSSAYKDNWDLSTARAVTVTRFLVTAGMAPSNLVASGAGEHDPAKSNDSPAGRQHNRRIEIVLLPALAELPPLPASLDQPAKWPPRAARARTGRPARAWRPTSVPAGARRASQPQARPWPDRVPTAARRSGRARRSDPGAEQTLDAPGQIVPVVDRHDGPVVGRVARDAFATDVGRGAHQRHAAGRQLLREVVGELRAAGLGQLVADDRGDRRHRGRRDALDRLQRRGGDDRVAAAAPHRARQTSATRRHAVDHDDRRRGVRRDRGQHRRVDRLVDVGRQRVELHRERRALAGRAHDARGGDQPAALPLQLQVDRDAGAQRQLDLASRRREQRAAARDVRAPPVDDAMRAAHQRLAARPRPVVPPPRPVVPPSSHPTSFVFKRL